MRNRPAIEVVPAFNARAPVAALVQVIHMSMLWRALRHPRLIAIATLATQLCGLTLWVRNEACKTGLLSMLVHEQHLLKNLQGCHASVQYCQ